MSKFSKEELDYLSERMSDTTDRKISSALDDSQYGGYRHRHKRSGFDKELGRDYRGKYNYLSEDSGSSFHDDDESYSSYDDDYDSDVGSLDWSARSPSPGKSPQGSGPSASTTESTSLDALLQKFSTMGPQEEPDPTTALIHEKLIPVISKWMHERVILRLEGCYGGFHH